MKRALLLPFLIMFLIADCKTGKDKSNTFESLLIRFLIRNSGSSVINPELPSSLSVPVPRSIRKSPSASASVRSGFAKDAEDVINGGDSGIAILQEGTSIVANILQESKRDLFLISGVYAAAKAKPGVCIPGGTSSVSIPPEAITEFEEGMQNLGLSADEAKAEVARLQQLGTLPTVGQSIPSPAIVYSSPSDPDFDHQVSFSFGETISASQGCPSNNKFQKVIRWKADKSRIYSSVEKSLKIFNVSLEINGNITYIGGNGKKDKAILKTSQVSSFGQAGKSKGSTRFIMEQCSQDSDANAGNCTTLSYASTSEANGSKLTSSVEGRTDDFGGYVKTKFKNPAESQNYVIEEVYDPDGTITWLSVDDGVSTYVYGDFDADLADLYGFGGDFDFEGEVKLDFPSYPPLGVGIGAGFTDYDAFVVVPAGEDPNDDEEVILGEGEYEDANSNNIVNSGEVYIEYWGEDTDVPNLKVWRMTFDPVTDDLLYVLLPTASVVVAP